MREKPVTVSTFLCSYRVAGKGKRKRALGPLAERGPPNLAKNIDVTGQGVYLPTGHASRSEHMWMLRAMYTVGAIGADLTFDERDSGPYVPSSIRHSHGTLKGSPVHPGTSSSTRCTYLHVAPRTGGASPFGRFINRSNVPDHGSASLLPNALIGLSKRRLRAAFLQS